MTWTVRALVGVAALVALPRAADAQFRPLCPNVDRTISEADARLLGEPHMRVYYGPEGVYEGVMHDAPDGPCRPREPGQEQVTTAPRCAVWAHPGVVSSLKASTVQGADVTFLADGTYMGATLPVSCAVWQPINEMTERLNAAAQVAVAAQRPADLDDARYRELLDILRPLVASSAPSPSPSGAVGPERDRERQQRQLDALKMALPRVGFSPQEIDDTIRLLDKR